MKKCPHLSSFIEKYSKTVNIGNHPYELEIVECWGEDCQLWWKCREPEEIISVLGPATCKYCGRYVESGWLHKCKGTISTLASSDVYDCQESLT